MLEVTGRVPEYLRRYRFQLAGLSAALAVYALLGFLLAPWLISKNLIEAVRANLDSELSLAQVNIVLSCSACILKGWKCATRMAIH